MFLCNESPRWLAKQERPQEALAVLTRIRQLPEDHPYIQAELTEVREQLEHERELVGGSSYKDLLKEMWFIRGNRNVGFRDHDYFHSLLTEHCSVP